MWKLRDGMYAYVEYDGHMGPCIFTDKDVWNEGAQVAHLDDYFMDCCYPTVGEVTMWEIDFGVSYPQKLIRRLMGVPHYRHEASLWFKLHVLKRIKDLCN